MFMVRDIHYESAVTENFLTVCYIDSFTFPTMPESDGYDMVRVRFGCKGMRFVTTDTSTQVRQLSTMIEEKETQISLKK